MTSVIAVVQLTAVLTIAILVCICLVCSYKNSLSLKRERKRIVVAIPRRPGTTTRPTPQRQMKPILS